jgi:hypothetical protein
MKFPNSYDITVVGRHNRPGVLNNTFLEMYFMNNGQYQTPYAISAVWVFPVPSSASAGEYLDLSAGSSNYGLVTSSSEIDYCQYKWTGSGTTPETLLSSYSFAASGYTGDSSQSRYIWRISEGRLGVVLDPDASAIINETLVDNQVSSIGEYYDIWQVKMTSTSDWTTYIGKFELFNDNFIFVTEPLNLKVKSRLDTPRVNEGSIIDLEIPVDITVAGHTTSEDIKTLFNHSVVDNAQIEIQRVVDNAPWIEVSGYSDTSGSVRVDSNDTIKFLLDTTTLSTVTGVGTAAGIYKVRAKFTILNETFVTDQFSLIVGR